MRRSTSAQTRVLTSFITLSTSLPPPGPGLVSSFSSLPISASRYLTNCGRREAITRQDNGSRERDGTAVSHTNYSKLDPVSKAVGMVGDTNPRLMRFRSSKLNFASRGKPTLRPSPRSSSATIRDYYRKPRARAMHQIRTTSQFYRVRSPRKKIVPAARASCRRTHPDRSWPPRSFPWTRVKAARSPLVSRLVILRFAWQDPSVGCDTCLLFVFSRTAEAVVPTPESLLLEDGDKYDGTCGEKLV